MLAVLLRIAGDELQRLFGNKEVGTVSAAAYFTTVQTVTECLEEALISHGNRVYQAKTDFELCLATVHDSTFFANW